MEIITKDQGDYWLGVAKEDLKHDNIEGARNIMTWLRKHNFNSHIRELEELLPVHELDIPRIIPVTVITENKEIYSNQTTQVTEGSSTTYREFPRVFLEQYLEGARRGKDYSIRFYKRDELPAELEIIAKADDWKLGNDFVCVSLKVNMTNNFKSTKVSFIFAQIIIPEGAIDVFYEHVKEKDFGYRAGVT